MDDGNAGHRTTSTSNPSSRHVALAVVLCTLAGVFTWLRGQHIDDLLDGVPVHPDMAAHSHEFDVPQVYKVTDGVYVAVGYAVANSILIEAPEGLIIVDTTESSTSAREIYAEFRKVSPHKPVKAIVLTHYHYDHCTGTEVFLENATGPIDIWGHHTLEAHVRQFVHNGPRLSWGATHQFGMKLDKHRINAGIGPRIRSVVEDTALPPLPNRLVVKETQQEIIAGLNITFIHIPGETPDQIGVWIPERRVLLPADDIYTTFPNLYAIRGTPPRDTTLWFKSLDRMRSLGAEYLVPSHTRPVFGADKIDELLRVYSAAIEFVHDQTVRMFNLRLSPDEIGEAIQLPPELAQHRYLQEFYGTAEWSAKGVYERYIGWFSGDPVDLRPLGPRQRASHYVQLAGGETKILKLAERAIKAGDFQWALELATHAYRASGERGSDGTWSGGRAWRAARDMKTRALKGLAGKERNPVARNYYLTAIVLDHIPFVLTPAEKRRVVDPAPASLLFEIMKLRLVPDKVIGANWTIVFRFTDTEQVFVLRLVQCVLRSEETKFYDGHFDAAVTTTLETWKAINVGERNPLLAYLYGELEVTGSRMILLTFLRSLDRL